jgi:hypothetical protein
MTPAKIRQAQARMRQAFTEACVNFPRLNVTPIQLALYQSYQDVAHFIGTTYVLMDPAIGGEILRMTAQAQGDLLAKRHTDRLLHSIARVEHPKYRSMLSGLDSSTGYTLMNALRDGMGTLQARAMRTAMLQTRRNLLANELAITALTTAANRFKESESGEGIVQTMPVTQNS